MKCPKCGTEATDEDFNNNEAELDFYVDDEGSYHWECFECNYEWIERK